MELIWALSRYILPVITVIILIKCIMTLLLGHPKEKTYGYVIDMSSGNRYPLNMWETSLGRGKSCDVVLPYDTVARSHAVITRRIDGWYVHDLMTKATLKVNGSEVTEKELIRNGDILEFGKNRFRFEVVDDPVQAVGRRRKRGNDAAELTVSPSPRAGNRGAYDYGNDAQLRKRTRQGGETQRPVTPPHYNSYGDSFTVETGSRPQSGRRAKKQPRIMNKDTGEVFILCGNEVSIGSARKADIRLQASGVEKIHSLLVLYEDGWAIDKAKGRAFLNGNEVKSPQLLFDGDIIAVCDERLYFHS